MFIYFTKNKQRVGLRGEGKYRQANMLTLSKLYMQTQNISPWPLFSIHMTVTVRDQDNTEDGFQLKMFGVSMIHGVFLNHVTDWCRQNVLVQLVIYFWHKILWNKRNEWRGLNEAHFVRWKCWILEMLKKKMASIEFGADKCFVKR